MLSSLPPHRSSPAAFRWLYGAACVCLCGTIALPLKSANPAVPSLVEREIAKRNSLVQEARALVTEAKLLHAKGEYEGALKSSRQAWEMLPDTPLTAALKVEARDAYSEAAVSQARKLAGNGHYPDAKALLKSVLAEDFDPANPGAKQLEKELEDPDRYEPALTPEHVANVSQVERDLRLGAGFLNLGDYDKAIQKFNAVLRIDPYNSAARRNMERAEQLKEQYYDTARDHVRATRLAAVDQNWEDAVPVSDVASLFSGSSDSYGTIGGAKENMLTKIRSFIIPSVSLQEASLEEVVEYLRIRSRELDPQKRGVDFVLRVSQDTAAKPVSLSMVNVPVEEVLRYATEMTGTVYRPDEYAISITSRSEQGTTLISKSYRVPPDFLQNAPADAPAAGAVPADPFQQSNKAAFEGLKIRRLGAKEFLEQRGILFPEGATAAYTPSTNILFVRNTAANLALVDTLVEEVSSAAPKQIEIQVRLLEINQTRLQELGFDWLLGQFNVPGSDAVFASGGTSGNQRTSPFTAGDFPIVAPGAGANLQYPFSPGPSGSNPPVGGNPVTAGLRSTGALFAIPSIDQLIGQTASSTFDARSPGTFALTGVFTDPQFQVVLRTLSQSKGVDFVTSPSIVTKSGQRANITIAREFIYPTEFDPPQVPQQVGGAINIGGTLYNFDIPDVVPITPSTPTAFEMRNVGVSLEVEPVVGDNNRTVDLNLVPSSTDFEGFIDYGEDIPIPNRATGTVVNQQNDILQPVFRSNKVTTSVTIWDGNTVVLGGVMYDKRQVINDKVPILGDIPLIGRSFQSKVSQLEKKNVIFFVTVKVIDPSGNRVNQPAMSPTTAGQ